MSTPTKLVLLALLLFTGVLFGQGVQPPAPEGPTRGLPIDGLIWLGGLAALTYGVIKKYNSPKK